jgi:DNA-binding GntR family transcriptional regulator
LAHTDLTERLRQAIRGKRCTQGTAQLHPTVPDGAVRLGIAEGDLCVRTVYEFLADGRPVQLSTSWEPYDVTAGTLVVLPEGGRTPERVS